MDPEIMKCLEELFESKLAGIKESVKDIEKVHENIKEIDRKLENNLEVMNGGFQSMAKEMQLVKEEQERQTVQIKVLQEEGRDCNLIFHGIKEEGFKETTNKILEIGNSVGLGISKYCIKDTRKLGKGSWKEEPVIVNFISKLLRTDILKNKKAILEKYPGINIKEDLPKEIRETRNHLREYSEKAIQNNLKVYMRQNKLVIHGKAWTLEELQKDTAQSFLSKPKRGREDDSPTQFNASKKTTTLTPQDKRVIQDPKLNINQKEGKK
uniref:Uncharacterized protein n=1 Tax=Cacopsylla melanoneura TaxID=428564 RepID=A0A8D9BNR2_9HEMI